MIDSWQTLDVEYLVKISDLLLQCKNVCESVCPEHISRQPCHKHNTPSCDTVRIKVLSGQYTAC